MDPLGRRLRTPTVRRGRPHSHRHNISSDRQRQGNLQGTRYVSHLCVSDRSMCSQQDGTYRLEDGLRRQAGRPAGIHSGGFSWRTLARALICRPKMSPGKGRFSGGGGGGAQGKIISLSSSSSPSSSPEDTDSEGVSTPRAVAAARATPLSRSFCFHERYL
jgi:hypothetical protein